MCPKSDHEELKRRIQELENRNRDLEEKISSLEASRDKTEHENALLRNVLDSIPDVIGIQFPDHSVWGYNKAGYDFLGKDKEEVLGKKCYELIGRESECKPCATSRALKTGRTAEVDKYIPEMDLYLNCRSVPVIGENGAISHIVEILRDETQKKRAEQEVEKARARYQHLFEEAPMGICLVDRYGRYISANTFYAQLYGYDTVREMFELMPDARSVFVHDEDWQSFLGLMQRQGKVVDFECRVRRKDGSQIWTSRTAREVRDSRGEVLHYEIFVMDIQARKEAALAAMQSRRQLLNVLEQLEAGVYVMNPDDNRIVYANRYMTELAGKNLVGLQAPSLLLQEGSDCPFCFDDNNTESPGVQSTELQFADNRWYLCTAKLTPWLGGESVVLVVAMDITSAKEAEQMKAEVDRIVRHDLKGPLNAIIGVPDILIQSGMYPAEDVELLEGVKSSGKKMLALIDSSFSLYRLETGEYEIEFEKLDLLRELEAIEKEVWQEFQNKNISIEYHLQNRPLSSTDYVGVCADRTLVPFLFSNLVKNAVEASPVNGVVDIDIYPGEWLTVSIHNQGVVPEDIRNNFFDKYVTSGKKKGTGLGTYSARLITEAHGGEISMFTSEKEGTTITVKLPRKENL